MERLDTPRKRVELTSERKKEIKLAVSKNVDGMYELLSCVIDVFTR